jgi:hypothetical protein
MQTARKIAMSGAVTPFHIPKHGFYAPRDGKGPTVLPEQMSLRATVTTIWKELTLRLRLAPKGFWRGLNGTGIVGVGRLYATVIRATGEIEHLGLLCTKVITDAGVAFLVDDWDVNTASATNDITTLKYHGCGTGTGAEAASDTALGTESTTALNPDSTRATGTQSQPAANQLRSVGTVTFDATAAITEHGVFSQAATGGGTLWDRSLFSAINVVSGDSIQFTYTCTVSSGG